jgi:hypothetical protein
MSEEYAERFPKTIIDDSDRDLFLLMKSEADEQFNGEVNEMLVYMLIKKDKMVRFSHDFKNNKLYIDFPKIK